MALLPIRIYIQIKGKRSKNNHLSNDNDLHSKNEYSLKLKRCFSCISIYVSEYIRYAIYITGKIMSHKIRDFLYSKVFMVKIGKGSVIYHNAEIRNPIKLQIGDYSSIGDNAILDARNGIIIGNSVNLSSNVSIWTEQHDHRDPYFKCTPNKRPVILEDYVWIGSNVEILPNVHIGKGAVCCAGCVVVKDVQPYEIVAGIPAKKIGERNNDLRYIIKQSPHFL